MTPERKRRLLLRVLVPAVVLVTAVSALAQGTASSAGREQLAADGRTGAATGAKALYADGARRPLAISAESYVAMDAGTGRVLVAHGERKRRPIASLTKVMTGLLVAEDGPLGGKVRVAREATLVEPNKDWLVAGRRYPRTMLLYSALLGSNNDAAAALAYDEGDGSIGRFYERMTERAHELGMRDTTYRSASGLNDVSNLSTAYDQALLAVNALHNPVVAKIVRTPRKAFPALGKTYVNHNKMLFSFPGTIGIKTGWTTRAGGCLAVAVERDGHTVVAVVLDSDGIWADMPRLVKRAFRQLERAAA